MGRNSIGYKMTSGRDGRKICGGSFGGQFDQETVERLVNHHLEVRVKPGGTPTFVDKHGEDVWLYVTVDPRNTEKGKAALESWQRERARIEKEQQELEEKRQEEIENLLENLDHEEAVRRLRGDD